MRMKRIFTIALSMLLLLSMLAACGSNNSIQDEWAKVILGDKLPVPQKGELRSGSNLDSIFMGGIEKVDESYFIKYKNACKELGYTIDSKESGNNYDAFNADAYKLSIYYYNKQISITLDAPEELSELVWPTIGIGAKLPAPKADLGKAIVDTSNSYKVIIGKTTRNEYADYVKVCEEQGFIVDYSKQDDRYEAEDAEGYRLIIRYIGCNRMEVTIQTPKEAVIPDTTEGSQTETKPSNEDLTAEISKDFKDAMDSYEKFMDEYVTFMKKYQASPTDFGLLTDYANYMSKYAEFVEDFAKWEDAEMNAAETAYYVDVQARVAKKLLEIAG